MSREYLKELEVLTDSLTKRTEILSSVLDSCDIGTWTWTPAHDTMKWDKAMLGIFEKEAKCVQDFIDCIHEDDKERVVAAVQESLSAKVPYDITYRINTAAGIKIIHARGRVVFEEKEPTRFIGVCVEKWSQ